jgi:hypothetical protein
LALESGDRDALYCLDRSVLTSWGIYFEGRCIGESGYYDTCRSFCSCLFGLPTFARVLQTFNSHQTTIKQTAMVASMSRMKATLLCLGSSVLAQNIDPTYGDNYTPVNKDDEAISRNYPDIDIDLLSPAFLNPETIPAGFANGTSGPTPDFVMSKSFAL